MSEWTLEKETEMDGHTVRIYRKGYWYSVTVDSTDPEVQGGDLDLRYRAWTEFLFFTPEVK